MYTQCRTRVYKQCAVMQDISVADTRHRVST